VPTLLSVPSAFGTYCPLDPSNTTNGRKASRLRLGLTGVILPSMLLIDG